MTERMRKPIDEEEEGVEGPTFNLFLVNIVFYIISTIIGRRFIITGYDAIFLLGFSYATFLRGFIWTPITSMFTHAGIFHIGGNMLFLFVYGFKLEERGYNDKSIYLAYISTGILASMLSAPLIGWNSISVGASGAVFGMLGVNAGIERREKSPTYKSVLYLSIILFVMSYGENTNVFAHLLGLIFGIILGNSKFFAQFKN